MKRRVFFVLGSTSLFPLRAERDLGVFFFSVSFLDIREDFETGKRDLFL